MKRSRTPEVYSITGARSGLSDDVSGRTRRYLISMSIRTACFVGAVLVHGPMRWVLLAGALLLPYLAVVAANAGRESTPGTKVDGVTPDDTAPTLLPGPSEPPQG